MGRRFQVWKFLQPCGWINFHTRTAHLEILYKFMGNVKMWNSCSQFIENFEFHQKFRQIFMQNAKAKYKSKWNLLKCCICWLNSYRNTNFECAVVVRYGNFFIPQVKKPLKISPWEKTRESFLANFWDEETTILDNWPIRKSYISVV